MPNTAARHFRVALFASLLIALGATGAPAGTAGASDQVPKRGGTLMATLNETPPSFSIHDETTIAAVWPTMPCYNNLVLFDPLKKQESPNTIIGELAERWSWQDDGRTLVFSLRQGVKWHDGQPFTAKDVKYTFDTVREAPGITQKLRVNPRKLWHANVESIEVPDPHTVVFRLKYPQPSLLMMLASGYSAIYPSHIPLAELRTKCVGTGPFKLKEYRPGEVLELTRNTNYFVTGRPYLDGIRYVIIKDRATRYAALQAGQQHIAFPFEISKTLAENAKKAVPSLVVVETTNNVNDHLLVNFKRPLFQDARVRRALSLAIDRKGYIQAGRQGAAFPGGILLPPPYGVWGLPAAEQAKLPGFGDPAAQKAEARQLLAEAGYGPGKPLKMTISTRAVGTYIDIASYILDQLKQVGVEGTLDQVETGVWHPKMTRREFDLAVNLTGIGPDDPDANLYENYKCGSARNYSDYCNEAMDKLIDQQSQTTDGKRRLALVHEIDRKLQMDGARLMLGWSKEYMVMWPFVKNLVPHQSVYNYGRMQEVWLDK